MALSSGATTSRNNAKTTLSIRNSMIKQQPMPLVGYEADKIIHRYDRRPLEVGWRLNSLSLPLLGWYMALLMDKTLGIDDQEAVQRKRGMELRLHLVRSGSVVLIKSGQALSLRPDLIRNKIWAEELGKLVDAVGSFPDVDAMDIMKGQLSDLLPRIQAAPSAIKQKKKNPSASSKLTRMVAKDPILSLFEFDNDNRAVASASIGQVYKAKIRRGPALEAAIGKKAADHWGGRTVAIKIQRPDAAAAASLDMYLIRRAAMWLSKFRGGDLPAIADQFGMQLFGELDYIREANNNERFRALYGDWNNVQVPEPCTILTRSKVLVQEWVDGQKGPWLGDSGIDMVRLGLKCSVDQLLHTGLFHSDPHRGNLLQTSEGSLAFLDFGMMADVTEEERYGLVGLLIGLQNKDLPLVTENLLKLGFLEDTTQIDELIPRLRLAVKNATGGTGKISDLNFSRLQAELDKISRENVLKFKTPPFFTIIIRSLTILEGFALSVDPKFRLVRGSYPYVLAQLLSPEDDQATPEELKKILVRLLTVNGEEKEVEWERLTDFLRLAQKAASTYDPSLDDTDDKVSLSRQTIDMFLKFLTSKTGLFLKKPLVLELAETIDGMASASESNLMRVSRGLLRPLPGGNGPVNTRRMEELRVFVETLQNALVIESSTAEDGRARIEGMVSFLREIVSILGDDIRREETAPILDEIFSVCQMVAVQILEIRGTRAMRNILRLDPQ
eukprot:CAMPEP_0197841658 /NCGR_PEP_ID=MMETSP1437-20131217/46305_1 /TAXON_ID=49252 ORGANISM="Eucampia antarctica, Strain CCMP1452" /NCGR_SAMPLE_ID=MMETSP1437 /ASSEMBLY_ACC=CAM_ASM_001096 /LENGTH=726 /DNA_ID=CAMNT_0043451449 /DNA_START=302 /DNA_END=2482 /DNA_ORIENTATION=+